MPCRRQSSVSFSPASYSRTIPMICSSVNRLVRICPPPERRSNRFSLSVAPFQGAGSDPQGGRQTTVTVDLRNQIAFELESGFSIEDQLFRYFLTNVDHIEIYNDLGVS